MAKPLSQRAIKALKASIAHHEANLKAETPEDVELGPQHCALCREYLRKDCKPCPVGKATGDKYCNNSPYIDLSAARWHWHWHKTDPQAKSAFRRAERKEIKFLKSLRDTEAA